MEDMILRSLCSLTSEGKREGVEVFQPEWWYFQWLSVEESTVCPNKREDVYEVYACACTHNKLIGSLDTGLCMFRRFLEKHPRWEVQAFVLECFWLQVSKYLNKTLLKEKKFTDKSQKEVQREVIPRKFLVTFWYQLQVTSLWVS